MDTRTASDPLAARGGKGEVKGGIGSAAAASVRGWESVIYGRDKVEWRHLAPCCVTRYCAVQITRWSEKHCNKGGVYLVRHLVG